MKAKILALSFFLIGTGSSMAQESDDLYFFSSDRAKLNETVAMDISTPDEPSNPVSFGESEVVTQPVASNNTVINNYYGSANPAWVNGNRFAVAPSIYLRTANAWPNRRFNTRFGVSPFFYGSNRSVIFANSGLGVSTIYGFGPSYYWQGYAVGSPFGGGGYTAGFANNINTFGLGNAGNYYCPPAPYSNAGVATTTNNPIPRGIERARGSRGGNNVVYAPSVTRESRAGRQVGASSTVATSTRVSSATVGSRGNSGRSYGSSATSGRSYTPRYRGNSSSNNRSYTPRSSSPSRSRSYTPSRSSSTRSSSPSRSRSSSTRSSSPSRSRSSSGSSGGSRSRGGRGN